MSLIFRRAQRLRAIQKNETVKVRSTKKTSTPIVLGILAAAVTPLAYLIGFYYYQGYLAGFGVAAENFPISAPDVYIYSYLAIGQLLWAIADWTAKLLTFVFTPPVLKWTVGCLVVGILAVYWVRRHTQRRVSNTHLFPSRIFKSFSQYLHPKNNAFTWAMGFNLILFYVICVLLVAFVYIGFFWVLFPWAAYSGGKEKANDEMIKFLTRGCQLEAKTQWNTCSAVLNEKNEVEHEGLFVAGNEKFFAFFNRNGSYVIPRKESHILRRRYEVNDK